MRVSVRQCLGLIIQCLLIPHTSGNDILEERSATNAYNASLGERLVNYAGAAYCSGQQKVTDWNCYACDKAPGFQNITSMHDPKTNGRGIVGYDPELGARVVAFMGTNANIKTWIDDLKSATLSPFPVGDCGACKAGTGFVETFEGLRDQVYTALDKLPQGPLYITGHSLGASLATLCALDYYNTTGTSPDALITMGQPRTGNTEFARYYNAKIPSHWRATHYKDPIPHLPYEWMGFSHLHTECFYNENGTSYKVCNMTNGEDPTCADQFGANLLDITDHWVYLGFSFVTDIIDCTI